MVLVVMMVPVVWMVLLVLLVLLSLLLLLVLLAVPIVLRFYPIHRYRYLRATTRPWGQSHRRTTTKSGPQQKVTISWPSTSKSLQTAIFPELVEVSIDA